MRKLLFTVNKMPDPAPAFSRKVDTSAFKVSRAESDQVAS
jgi:hypothetical protein